MEENHTMNNFNEDGYIIRRNHFDQSDLAAFELAASEAARWYVSAFGYVPSSLDRSVAAMSHEGKLGELYDTWSQMPEMLALQGYRTTREYVRDILGQVPLYNFKGRCLIAMPGDERRTYDWHQQTFYGIPKTRFVQTWGPLIRPTTKENGTIWVLPGSHKEGIAPAEWKVSYDRADQITVAPEIVAKYEPRQIEMELGDLLIFDGALIHKSGVNVSKEVRYSLVGEFYAVDGNFRAVQPEFKFRGPTPREWYDAHFPVQQDDRTHGKIGDYSVAEGVHIGTALP